MDITALIPRQTMKNVIRNFTPKIQNAITKSLEKFKEDNNCENAAVFIAPVKEDIYLFISEFSFDSNTGQVALKLDYKIKFSDFIEKLLTSPNPNDEE